MRMSASIVLSAAFWRPDTTTISLRSPRETERAATCSGWENSPVSCPLYPASAPSKSSVSLPSASGLRVSLTPVLSSSLPFASMSTSLQGTLSDSSSIMSSRRGCAAAFSSRTTSHTCSAMPLI